MAALEPIRHQPHQQIEHHRSVLRALRQRLARRELELVSLSDQLAVFERRYHHLLGFRYRRLAERAERLSELRHPSGRPGGSGPELGAAALGAAYAPLQQDAAGRRPRPPEPARRLFRKLVRRVHPDLAGSAEERARRNRVMVLANLAYERGDVQALRELLEEWELDPDQVRGEDADAELTRLLRRISLTYRRLQAVEAELGHLGGSHLGTLFRDAQTSRGRGVDLLVEMSAELDRLIERTEAELREAERGRGPGPAREPVLR
ncbi:MAG TPA: hypothetical protein VKG45_00250 [Actinomycetes bacterium]|nr:hypothetical protein [Actinomycetes bacterium]